MQISTNDHLKASQRVPRERPCMSETISALYFSRTSYDSYCLALVDFVAALRNKERRKSNKRECGETIKEIHNTFP